MSQKLPGFISSRRRFLRNISSTTAATAVATAVGLPSLSLLGSTTAVAEEDDPSNDNQRAKQAYQFRRKAALDEMKRPFPDHPDNGDEERYAKRIGSYSKAMPHNTLGEVDVDAYDALVHAMETGDPVDFDAIPLGGTVKQANPQSALAFELDGADSHHLGIPAPPAFASRNEAAEMCEVYWQALTRDVPFSQYGLEPLTSAAINELSTFPKFSGVTAGNLFRGETPGDLVGPYISQFLWKPFSFGALVNVAQQYRTTVAGDDHMTAYGIWLNIQNGVPATVGNTFDTTRRYIRNGRDLAEWDHRDFTYQGCLVASLILLGFGAAALDDANPYKSSTNQSGFATFGNPHILDLVARAACLALKATWYQKWSVHRRLRPEEFGGRLHNHKMGAAFYPIRAQILNSQAVQEVFNRYGTYLLPMAYPEGAPTHPAYPAGHAAIAGACVTVLKAFFKESFVIPSPLIASDDGLALAPYNGTLTVGDELNKLAANIAIGRDTAGVHWRSDGIEGIKLGEQVGISLLRDYRKGFNETFGGFSLSRFDGTTITI